MQLLRELQRRCYDAFVHGDTARLVPYVAGPAPAPRIGVYRNNALETARKTLQATFPALRQLVGDACFRTLSRDYLSRFPSRSGNLEHFGAAFPELLDALYGGGEFDYLADVARLEWACEQAWLAPEPGPTDLTALTAVAPEQAEYLRLTLHPSCRLIASRYPVLSVWRTTVEHRDDVVRLDAGGERVLIGRSARGVDLRPLTAAGFAFLDATLRRGNLTEACGAGLAEDPGFEPGALIIDLARWHLLTGASVANPTAC